jgi:hypothetical protein
MTHIHLDILQTYQALFKDTEVVMQKLNEGGSTYVLKEKESTSFTWIDVAISVSDC